MQTFSWIIPEKLAAMGRPSPVHTDLEYLKDQDISVIIGLTESRLTQMFIDEFGFTYFHIPVPDFAAPRPEQIASFVEHVSTALAAGQRVAVHCEAGQGRTGTMIACFLVHEGRTAEEAIDEIRRLRPGSIETDEQEEAVREYERRR